jgi:thymidylate synthase (FAD)
MHRVEPKVFLVGETALNNDGLEAYFKHINTKWRPDPTVSPSETLIEVYGRMCYRSWEAGMNPNVTKVREGNDVYISNIVQSKHGSVIEHPVTNWIFADVSRVFTHELVRHRVGTAFSQESLRYVRLEDLGLWIPPEVESDPVMKALFEETFTSLGDLQLKMATHLKLNDTKNFHYKKTMTSAMRRVAPDGLATSIGVSMNFRALRHLAEMRTSNGAETEIRLVFNKIMDIASVRWPNILKDFEKVMGENNLYEWKPKFSKI